MDEEIEKAKRIMEEKKREKAKAATTTTATAATATAATITETPEKKSVFAKLKNYNRDTNFVVPQSSKTSKQAKQLPPPPPSTKIGQKKEEDYILKERSNRYSYEGKLRNFSFLKKVDRKVVDKHYAMSFKEYKEYQNKLEKK
jgi:hypothetical protein